MTKLLLLIIVTVLVAAPVLGQVDMVNGQDSYTDFTTAIYNRHSSGNQDWVREYDGRNFGIGFDALSNFGYNGGLGYRLDARDVLIQDESVFFALDSKNLLGARFLTDKLTHRLDRVPPINPFLADTTAAGGDVFIDLAPDQRLALDRRVWDLGLNLTPLKNNFVRFVGNWWVEKEDGAQQVLFYSRAALPGEPPAPPARTRHGSALLINRATQEGTLGFDTPIGRRTSFSYRFENTRFDDDRFTPPPGTTVVPPVNRIIAPNSDTDANILKLRSRLTERLFFSGSHVSRNRDNSTSILGVDGLPEPRTNRIEVDATNLGLSFLATNSLTITGRYRRYDLTNMTDPILVGDLPENQNLSLEQTSFLLEGTYTGIRRAFLRGSFERREVDRGVNPLHTEHEEFEHPFISTSTRSNIWRAGFRYYPLSRLSFSGDFQNWDIDDPGYTGAPSKRRRMNLEGTYMATNTLAFYANYNRWNRENNATRVPLDELLGLAPGDPGYEEARQVAAGQNYTFDFTTMNLGAWYAINPKLTLDANIGRVKSDAEALLLFGIDVPFLPHLPPDLAPYDSEDDMWSAGLTYRFMPKWRTYGRFQRSNSDGRLLLDVIPVVPTPGVPDAGPVWTPISVTEDRYTLGIGYTISARDQLLVDFSTSRWVDGIDPGQTGRFGLWRLAWARQY